MTRSRSILVLLGASFLLAGFVEPLVAQRGQPNSAAGVVHTIVIAVLCYLWCKADALERGATSVGGAVWAGLLPPIGVPLYLFRSRPPRAALLSVGLAVLFLFAALLLFAIGSFIGEGVRG